MLRLISRIDATLVTRVAELPREVSTSLVCSTSTSGEKKSSAHRGAHQAPE
jgi:hypothetical protein